MSIEEWLQFTELEEASEPVRMDERSAAITEMVETVDSYLGQRWEPEDEYSRGFYDALETVRTDLLAMYGSGEDDTVEIPEDDEGHPQPDSMAANFR